MHIKRILRNSALYSLSLLTMTSMPMVALAKQPVTYTYDAVNERWNTNKWVYDPASGVYVPAKSQVAPADTTKDTEVPVVEDTPTTKTDDSAIIDGETNISSDTTSDTKSTIDNDVAADSKTGDAAVKSNTKAGDAISGDANADTTIVNSVHSTVGGDTAGIAHFTTNIYGDVVGDITIGPSIDAVQNQTNTNVDSHTSANNDTAITNDVKLNSTSGDATVKGNTSAGNAKTGNANVVANVLNLINTIIAANKSFVGTVNIYGNLDGDILVSPDFIPQLLASNKSNSTTVNLPLALNSENNDSIVNNVKLNATTGDATVQDNTGAGNAKTGTATTNLTILNLTGHAVDATKSLLVFVNVLGKWVGMIVDAPGATAAAFGSGGVSDTVNVSDITDVTNNNSITNNLDLSAVSGDASVTKNTSAGDATSGDATASANIANISTSTFQLSDWFGVLFINVFGTWIGSFGIDTSAGTVKPITKSTARAVTGAPNMQFGFVPKAAAASTATGPVQSEEADKVMQPADQKNTNQRSTSNASSTKHHDNPFLTTMTIGGFMAAGIYGGGYGLRLRRRK